MGRVAARRAGTAASCRRTSPSLQHSGGHESQRGGGSDPSRRIRHRDPLTRVSNTLSPDCRTGPKPHRTRFPDAATIKADREGSRQLEGP